MESQQTGAGSFCLLSRVFGGSLLLVEYARRFLRGKRFKGAWF